MMVINWLLLGPNPCAKCFILSGYIWEFTIGIDHFPTQLIHPSYGAVWDNTTNESEAHGGGPWNCHCGISVTWELSDLENLIASMKDALQQ